MTLPRLTASGPGMIPRGFAPAQLETPFEVLGDSRLTPAEWMFVRSHHRMPVIDLLAWRLQVGGVRAREPLSLSLPELKRLTHAEVECVLECAGNGRARFAGPPSGVAWEHGAVANARWTGVRLADVLDRAGWRTGAAHVWFDGADRPDLQGAATYQRSLPLAVAAERVLLAWGMNDAPLTPHHGAPLRAVVPGWYGMASVKWLTKISIEDHPSDSPFMTRDYRLIYPTAERIVTSPVDEVLVKSLITYPRSGETVPGGELKIEGLAWGGVAPMRRVEVSLDQGRNWWEASLDTEAPEYAWRRWQATVLIPVPGRHRVLARAVDARGVSQPRRAAYNARGYANNAIHEVAFDSVPRA